MESRWLRQLDSGKLSGSTDKWAWNDKMDLLAVSTGDGSIVLHGHEFRPIWRAASADGSLPCTMDWRPDGIVLAVGYESGQLTLFSIDSSQALYNRKCQGPIISVQWSRNLYSSDVVDCEDDALLSKHDRCGTDAYLDTLVLLYKETRTDKLHLEFLATGVQSIFRISLNAADVLDRDDVDFRVCGPPKSEKVLPDPARFVVWIGEQAYQTVLPVDWDVLCHFRDLVLSLRLRGDERPLVDWCREVWDKLGSLQNLQNRFRTLYKQLASGELRDQLLMLLATGSTKNEKIVEFMNDVYDDHTIRSSSALLLLSNACEKLIERLCKLLRMLEVKYRVAAELQGLIEFYPSLRPIESRVAAILNLTQSTCLVATKICEKVRQFSQTFMPFFRWFLLMLILFKNDTQQTILPELRSLTFEDVDNIERYIQTTFVNEKFQIDPISQYFLAEPLKHSKLGAGSNKSLLTLWDELNTELSSLLTTTSVDPVEIRTETVSIPLRKSLSDVLFSSAGMVALDTIDTHSFRIRRFDGSAYATRTLALQDIGLEQYRIKAAKLCMQDGSSVCVLLKPIVNGAHPTQMAVIETTTTSYGRGRPQYRAVTVDDSSGFITFSFEKRVVLIVDGTKERAFTWQIVD